MLGAVGVRPDFDTRDIELLEGVREVVRITQPYKLASRQFRPEGTVVDIGKGVKIGGPEVVVAAGPCAVESEADQYYRRERGSRRRRTLARRRIQAAQLAVHLSRHGRGRPEVDAHRGRPQRLVGGQRGDGPFANVLLMPYVDILQVGARNMQNYHLLRALGEVRKPVLLKRGMSATIEELLLSAEYIMSGGNYNVILCERGIRTFETSTRNTLDIAAIPVIQKLSHLPIVADPSHGTGRRDKVAPMARAAVAAGADGLLLEVHNDPEHALSDGAQSLFPDQFAKLMTELRIIAPAVGRRVAE